MSEQTEHEGLPPLPELPDDPEGYSAVQMRKYALAERERCAMVCRNLNQATHGFERGPDCARAILGYAEQVAAEINGGIWGTSFASLPEYRAEQAEKTRKARELLDGLANENGAPSP